MNWGDIAWKHLIDKMGEPPCKKGECKICDMIDRYTEDELNEMECKEEL